jgi:hypothetical protein
MRPLLSRERNGFTTDRLKLDTRSSKAEESTNKKYHYQLILSGPANECAVLSCVQCRCQPVLSSVASTPVYTAERLHTGQLNQRTFSHLQTPQVTNRIDNLFHLPWFEHCFRTSFPSFRLRFPARRFRCVRSSPGSGTASLHWAVQARDPVNRGKCVRTDDGTDNGTDALRPCAESGMAEGEAVKDGGYKRKERAAYGAGL